ncbi:MAG: PRTRC system protein E [Agriterribacter sp.]
MIGGKWKGGKTKGFVFEQDPTVLLKAQANGEQRNLKKEYQFFATPQALAVKMARKLTHRITPGEKILEPSAGDGALMLAVWQEHGNNIEIDCYEAMELNHIKLNILRDQGAFMNMLGTNFLRCDRKEYYDYIIANPPFTNSQDILHICKMYQCLKPGGTIVTLASPSWTFGSKKIQIDFRSWLIAISAEQSMIDEGTFKESGTNIQTVMLEIRKPLKKIIDVPASIIKKLTEHTISSIEEKALDESWDDKDRTEEILSEAESAINQVKENNTIRKCRVCGCTDDDCRQCIKKTGKPCHWVEADLCSACDLPAPEVLLEDMIQNEKKIQGHLNELKSMLSPKNSDMNFFEQLAAAGNVDMTIRIMQKNERLTLNVMPGSGQSVTQPIIITGTGKELDAEFFSTLYPQVDEVKGIVHNLEAVKKEAQQKRDRASKSATPAKEEKPAAAKPANKKAKPEKKVKVKKVEEETRKDLFAASSEEQSTENKTNADDTSSEESDDNAS